VSAVPGRELTATPGLHQQLAWVRSRAEEMEARDWPHTNRLLPWGVAVFIVMFWLVPFDSITLPVSLPLDASLDRPLLVGFFGLWLIITLNGNEIRRRRATPVHWALLAFALVALVSIVANMTTLAGLGELSVAVKKLSLLFTYGLFFVVAASVIRPREVPAFITLMIGLASITAIGILVEYRTGYNAFFQWSRLLFPGTVPPVDIGTYDSIGRLTIVGPGTHPLAPAVMMSLALPFAVVRALDAKERRAKVWYALACGLILAAAMATQRKTSLVLPIAALLVLTAYRPRAMVRMVPIGIGLLIAIHAIAPGAIGGVTDQLKPSALTGVLTTKDRVSDYDAIRPEIANRPMLGRGYESYDQKKYRILDNQYLTLLVGVGVLGVISFVAMFAALFLLAHRLARSRDPMVASLGMAAAAAVVVLTIGSALLDSIALPQVPYLFCLIAALAVAASRGRAASTSGPTVQS
jgi:hypothetical protein